MLHCMKKTILSIEISISKIHWKAEMKKIAILSNSSKIPINIKQNDILKETQIFLEFHK